jgi:hypothetical protein
VLPAFDKVGTDPNSASPVDRSKDPNACGLSYKLPVACDECVRSECCDRAKECGEGTACGEDLLEPITPVADFSVEFDSMLGCMQRRCNAACNVDWGCVGDYEWPEAEGSIDLAIDVVDFAGAEDFPIGDVTVSACDAVDPGCRTGRRAQGVTGDDGKVVLPDLSAAFDGFYTFEGGETDGGDPYVSSSVQWNQPVHRIGGFTQYQLSQVALKSLALLTKVHRSADDEFDPDRGHLIVRVQGCLPMRYLNRPDSPQAEAENARLSFEPSEGATRFFYTEESGAVSTTLEMTTSDGVGGAFNVQPTTVSVTAVDTVSGKEMASGDVLVNAGSIAYMYLVANPD